MIAMFMLFAALSWMFASIYRGYEGRKNKGVCKGVLVHWQEGARKDRISVRLVSAAGCRNLSGCSVCRLQSYFTQG